MNDTAETPDVITTDYTKTLGEIAKGRTLHHINKELQAVVAGVREHGKKGTLTVTLELDPGKHDQVFVKATTKAKIPTDDPETAIFFTTPANGLQRNDPNQMEFPSEDS